MSSNPGGGVDLGSASATIGYRYLPEGLDAFLAGNARAQEAIDKIQQKIAASSPLRLPVGGVADQLSQLQGQITRLGEQVAAADVFKPMAASAKRARASVTTDIDAAAAEAERVQKQLERLATVPIGGIRLPGSPRAADAPIGSGIAVLPPGAANLGPDIAATEKLTAAERARNTVLEQTFIHEERLQLATATHAQRVAILTASLDRLRLASNAENSSEEQRIAVIKRTESAEIALAREEAALAREQQSAAAAQGRQATEAATGGLRGALRGLGGEIGGGLIGGLGVAGGAAILSQQLVQLGKDSIDLAVKAETIGTAYTAATKRAGIGADDLRTRLDAAARGTVSDTNLMATANKSLALGVGQNATQIADLLAIARQKGKDFGLDTATAFDNITTGLGRLSPRILDNIGIILDDQKIYADYAKTLGTTADRLSDQQKRQALVNDLIKNNTDLIGKNATAQDEAADKIARAQAKIENAKTKVGTTFLPAIGTVAETGAAIVTGDLTQGAIRARDQALAASTTTLDGYTKARVAANGADLISGDAVQIMTAQLAIMVGPLDDATVKLIQQAAAHTRNADAATANARALAKVNDALAHAPPPTDLFERHFADDRNQANLRAAESARTLAANEKQLAIDTIAANDQIVARRTADQAKLDDLEHQNQDAHAAAATQIGDIERQAQADMTEANTKGAADRLAIVADNADRLSTLIADHAKQDARTLEDQQRSDARDAADFASRRALDNQHFREQELASQAAFDESRALDNKHFAEQQAASDADYATRRAALVASQHEAQLHRNEDFARQEQRAREVAQDDELKSTENFVQRLFEATRGRGGAGKRAEANKELAQARAEAAELAKTDAAAAAAYLAERQRQILEGLDVAQSNRQLRKDAKRGGAFGSSEAEAEIAAETQARDDANKAALDLIRQQAAERAADRARQQGDQATADKTALSDLDTNYATQKQKAIAAHKEQQDEQDAAFAEQKQKAAAAHTEQQKEEDAARAEALKRRDADRVVEKKRRDADYAQQLQDLKDSNAKRLTEFDTAQTERLTQIGKHAVEQATATQNGLKKVDAEYEAARKKVGTDYDTFIAALKKKLQDEANDLKLTPDDERQKQLVKDYQTLGDLLGQSFADALKQAIQTGTAGAFGPVPGSSTGGSNGGTPQRVPGGIIFDNNTANDPRPNQAGINSVVRGGVLGDTFDAQRPGTTDIHQGIDILATEGTPIHAPVRMKIVQRGVGTGAKSFEGKFVIGIDELGREWYFGHVSAFVAPLGKWVEAGEVIARVGHTGAPGIPSHVHVQLRDRPGVTPTDPSGALDTAGQQPGTDTAPPGGPSSTGSDYRSQALHGGPGRGYGTQPVPGMEVWAAPPRPVRPDIPPALAHYAASSTVTIDLSHATFGPGLTRAEVEGWFRPITEAAIRDNHADGRRDLLRRISHFDAQGALRS